MQPVDIALLLRATLGSTVLAHGWNHWLSLDHAFSLPITSGAAYGRSAAPAKTRSVRHPCRHQ
jgi:hypothetical protein